MKKILLFFGILCTLCGGITVAAEENIVVDEVIYTNALGKQVSIIEPGEITAEVTIVNNGSTTQEVIVLQALYQMDAEQGLLTRAVTEQCTLSAKCGETVSLSLTVPSDGRAYQVKTFVWDKSRQEPLKTMATLKDETKPSFASCTMTMVSPVTGSYQTYTAEVDECRKIILFNIPYNYDYTQFLDDSRYSAVKFAFTGTENVSVTPTTGVDTDISTTRPTFTFTKEDGSTAEYRVVIFKGLVMDGFCSAVKDPETGVITSGNRKWTVPFADTQARAGDVGVDIIDPVTAETNVYLKAERATNEALRYGLKLDMKDRHNEDAAIALSGKVAVSFRFRLKKVTLEGGTTAFNPFYSRICDIRDADGNSLAYVDVITENKVTEEERAFSLSSGGVTTAQSFEPGVWHQAAMVLELGGGSVTGQEMAAYYFNGVKHPSPVPDGSSAAGAAAMSTLMFQTSQKENRPCELDIDSVKIGVLLD